MRGNGLADWVCQQRTILKNQPTDYVARQYLGSVGKIDNGIVTVNAYGVYCNITFSLIVKVFKPKGTPKESDKYKTKIELASEIITELIKSGFNIKLVLADSLYGESSQFIQKLTEEQLAYIVAIKSNHGVWLPASQKNLRLILQPLLLFWLIYPWLDIFPNSDLFRGFNHLITAMNQFKSFYTSG